MLYINCSVVLADHWVVDGVVVVTPGRFPSYARMSLRYLQLRMIIRQRHNEHCWPNAITTATITSIPPRWNYTQTSVVTSIGPA